MSSVLVVDAPEVTSATDALSWNTFELLDQADVWVTADRRVVRVVDMSRRDRLNVLFDLAGDAKRLRAGYRMWWLATHAPDGETAACGDRRCTGDPREWLLAKPLMRALQAPVSI